MTIPPRPGTTKTSAAPKYVAKCLPAGPQARTSLRRSLSMRSLTDSRSGPPPTIAKLYRPVAHAAATSSSRSGRLFTSRVPTYITVNRSGRPNACRQARFGLTKWFDSRIPSTSPTFVATIILSAAIPEFTKRSFPNDEYVKYESNCRRNDLRAAPRNPGRTHFPGNPPRLQWTTAARLFHARRYQSACRHPKRWLSPSHTTTSGSNFANSPTKPTCHGSVRSAIATNRVGSRTNGTPAMRFALVTLLCGKSLPINKRITIP